MREEADDVIASYVGAYGNDLEIVIASQDSDLFQLVGERVSVLRYRGEKTRIWTPLDVNEKYGVLPQQYADWKALVGDPSDNIKGAPGIGPKTAAQLLGVYPTLFDLLANVQALKRPAHRLALAQNAEKNHHKLQNHQALARVCDPLAAPLSRLSFGRHRDHAPMPCGPAASLRSDQL